MSPLSTFSVGLLLAAACSSSPENDATDAGNLECEVPVYTDDLVLDSGAALDLPGDVQAITSTGSTLLACGVDFVWIGAAGEASATHTTVQLAAGCAGIAVSADRAVVVSTGGAVTLLSVDTATPALAILSEASTPPATIHDVAFDGSTAWLAAGSMGVLRYDTRGDGLAEQAAFSNARDARGLAVVDGSVLVADGYVEGEEGGAEIRLLSATGELLAEITELGGIAARVYASGGRAVVLRPGFGFDVLTVTDSTMSLAYSHYEYTGIPRRASFRGETLLVVAVAELIRYDVGETEATAVSREARADRGELLGSWFADVVAVGDTYAVVIGQSISPLSVGSGAAAPYATSERYTYAVGTDNLEELLIVDNRGTAPLIITGAEADAPFSAEVYADLATEREGCPGQYVVEPDDSILVWQRYAAPVEEWSEGPLRILSNDPDHAVLTLRNEFLRPEATDAAAFALPAVDGLVYSSEDFGDKVLLVKLYNPL